MMHVAWWLSPELAIACNEVVFRLMAGETVSLTAPACFNPSAALEARFLALEDSVNQALRSRDQNLLVMGRVADVTSGISTG